MTLFSQREIQGDYWQRIEPILRAPGIKHDGVWQPLFDSPAYVGQEPVAWRHFLLIFSRTREGYDPSLEWTPLYLAR
jgi:hypothetical protein